ncbi:hypothetical protein FBZ99_11434 [Rhizobium sp. ERR 1071]|uniref:hypothetical protein n=1 Tax=Rhizobium sp. ERR 1071 TaxID=2572677 RepID=UPI00119B8589|nr:hypothetical protein [Rhizobium sp. ERR1071]TWB09570.1 hypothetical protein FBZ99_11434 [Rhizobium sp. ERR1071]
MAEYTATKKISASPGSVEMLVVICEPRDEVGIGEKQDPISDGIGKASADELTELLSR